MEKEAARSTSSPEVEANPLGQGYGYPGFWMDFS